jgi:hypothetical protein
MTTWDQIRAFLVGLPGAEPYDEAVKVKKKVVAFRTHNRKAWPDNVERIDEVVVAIRCDHLERAGLIQEDPATYYVTPHYDGWDGVLVRVATADPAQIRELLIDAYRRMAPPRIIAELDRQLAARMIPDSLS